MFIARYEQNLVDLNQANSKNTEFPTRLIIFYHVAVTLHQTT